MEDPTVQSARNSIIKRFEKYVEEKGYPDENALISVPVVILVGYFLKVHSKNPGMAVLRYLNSNTISYQKSNEVKMMLKALEAR